ncbi:MAG: hypothetical protein ACRDRY_02935 [Pseudonocardiaceae bacterium]
MIVAGDTQEGKVLIERTAYLMAALYRRPGSDGFVDHEGLPGQRGPVTVWVAARAVAIVASSPDRG